MKVYGQKTIEVVVDRCCDICGTSVMVVDSNGVKLEEVGELTANWGFRSKMDGITHHLDMCESCFQVALSALKEHRRSIVMFDDEQDLPDEKFGQQPVGG
ncbi:hypothetical protein C4C99_RS20635 [Vibrio parahaemolyticus]|nr:hypothetical protein [Vibrio parahaemolyticus]EGQ8281911.1 hypothetical protein [Vibrio parahaemolyticus]EGQ8719876.1 hypothetical protein [Vibrio parahaemolyticus]EGQ8813214.1 hypothetical protein [Vibrio parahaemolyticus]EGQ8838112.1 hypothetical protein [Vibrio parahaemolyticus]